MPDTSAPTWIARARTARDRARPAAGRPHRRGRASSGATFCRPPPSPSRPGRTASSPCSASASPFWSGLTPLEEDEVIRGLRQRVVGEFARHEEETAIIELLPEKDDQIPPGGPIFVKDLSPARLVVIADALSKSVVLARDEKAGGRRVRAGRTVCALPRRKGPPTRGAARNPQAYRQRAAGAAAGLRQRRGRGKARRPVGSPRSRAPLCPSRGRIRAEGAGRRPCTASSTSSATPPRR